jgi:hypothetical protein
MNAAAISPHKELRLQRIDEHDPVTLNQEGATKMADRFSMTRAHVARREMSERKRHDRKALQKAWIKVRYTIIPTQSFRRNHSGRAPDERTRPLKPQDAEMDAAERQAPDGPARLPFIAGLYPSTPPATRGKCSSLDDGAKEERA